MMFKFMVVVTLIYVLMCFGNILAGLLTWSIQNKAGKQSVTQGIVISAIMIYWLMHNL